MTTTQTTFEASLKPGAEVLARWSCSYRSYSAKATVVRVNGASIRVRLADAIYEGPALAYEAGREISLPRCGASRYGYSNGVSAAEVA